MKIELLALLDLIETLLKGENAQKVHEVQIQSQLRKFTEIRFVEDISKEIEESNYTRALEFVSGYRVLCKELLSIYNSLSRDYDKLKENCYKDEVVEILNEKYGISKIKEVVNLLELKHLIKSRIELASTR